SYQDAKGVAQSSARAHEIWSSHMESIAAPEIKFWSAHWMNFSPPGNPSETLAHAFQLCSEAAALGHRPAYFYCNDYDTRSGDRARTVANIEKAVTMKPWTSGLNIE